MDCICLSTFPTAVLSITGKSIKTLSPPIKALKKFTLIQGLLQISKVLLWETEDRKFSAQFSFIYFKCPVSVLYLCNALINDNLTVSLTDQPPQNFFPNSDTFYRSWISVVTHIRLLCGWFLQNTRKIQYNELHWVIELPLTRLRTGLLSAPRQLSAHQPTPVLKSW